MTDMPHGLSVTLTHTGLVNTSLLLSDVYPTTDGHTAYRRAGAVYVPVGGTVVLTYSDTVAVSLESGTIRGFVDLGYLTATLSFGGDVVFPPSNGDVSGTYPSLTVVGIQGFLIDNAAPANGDALLYNGITNQWEHSPIVFGGGPPVGPAGGDLGGLYPNPTVDGLQARPVDAAAPNADDALVWDGAKWTPTPVGSALQAVWGQFSDSTDQSFAGGTFVVKYNTDEGSNGVSVVNDPVTLRPTRITVAQDGVYAINISPQLLHTGGGAEVVTFWARLDGITIPRSASSLEMGNNNNRTLPFMEIVLHMNAGQYFEWVFTSSVGTDLSLKQFPASGAVPVIPSVIVNVKRLGA